LSHVKPDTERCPQKEWDQGAERLTVFLGKSRLLPSNFRHRYITPFFDVFPYAKETGEYPSSAVGPI
jgi:hypothetical protein